MRSGKIFCLLIQLKFNLREHKQAISVVLLNWGGGRKNEFKCRDSFFIVELNQPCTKTSGWSMPGISVFNNDRSFLCSCRLVFGWTSWKKSADGPLSWWAQRRFIIYKWWTKKTSALTRLPSLQTFWQGFVVEKSFYKTDERNKMHNRTQS